MKTLLVLLLLIVALGAGLLALRSRKQVIRSAPAALNSDSPVDSHTAARRALCLASLVLRAQAEYQLHPEPGDIPPQGKAAPADFALRQNSWLQNGDLWSACSARERELFQRAMGSWTRQETADGQWREESLGFLWWALDGSRVFLPYDVPAAQTDVLRGVPDPSAARAFIEEAKLRDIKEIGKQRDIAELWLWRARTTQLQRDKAEAPKGLTFEQIIAMTAEKAAGDNVFKPIGNDFPALGKPYSRLTETEWQTMRSIAEERLYVLNWLCGRSTDWDSVKTDT